MKAIFSLLTILVFSSSIALSQSTVTINATGNRNKQIVVDGKTYTIDNASATEQQEITISDLGVGQHTLELIRQSRNNASNASTKTNFTLREGYDMAISISANGSISTSEKRIARGGNQANSTISTAAFNKLYTQIKSKTSSTERANILQTELNNSRRKFSSKQASQLIQLVNSESLRLKLAKQAYPRISDTQNFNLVSNLLNSSSNRAELNTYIASLNVTGNNDDPANTGAPISDSRFSVIYNEVVAEPTSAERSYYLNNFFSRDFNFYTTAQAKQLIQLATAEQDRLSAAKAAYRGVIDKENYYSVVYPLLSSSANRSELSAYVKTYDNNNPGTAMVTANFDKLYQNIYYQNSASGRYTSINTAFTTPGNYFSVAQAKKLITLVSDQNSRLQLVKTSYKVLTDRSNYLQLNDLLTSTASRTEFNTYVTNYENMASGGGTTGTTAKTPMTETEFKDLYRSVQFTFGFGAKYDALTTIFNTETNYFTVAQAKQLIQLVSSESNRLELAKSSYNNVTDASNFSLMYDLFTSQTTKNQLMAYVNSNAFNN
jgi:hypothetical protein